jgi:LmbE family N-acetylglucosaminyl deacetylase
MPVNSTLAVQVEDANERGIEGADPLHGAVLVVAHPDDEVLWFSGVLADVLRIVICFGPHPKMPWLGPARERVRSRYPLKNVTWLELPEPMSTLAADWSRPEPTAEGLRLSIWSGARASYRSAFERVCAALERELPPGANVITHNPWGEYGHEDHVLVHRAVTRVARERGARVWYSNYCSLRSLRLAAPALGRRRMSPTIVRRTDPLLAHAIRDIYVDELCWTWDHHHEWPDTEAYVEVSDPETGNCQVTEPVFKLNLLCDVKIPERVGPLARARFRAMRLWRREFTRLAASFGAVRRMRTADRDMLEQCILPYLGRDQAIREVLFVGVDWYTKWYERFFSGKRWMTIDNDRSKARFGSSHRHVVDTLSNLSAHFESGTVDAIVCNGVLGSGLNDRAEIERAISECWRVLRPGGHLVLGWNDVAPLRPLRPEQIASLSGGFTKWLFPPLAVSRHVINVPLRHTYDFYSKESSP